MRRLREILVGLDGSLPAFHALKESIRLAQWAKGRVTAIAVTPSYEGDLSLVGVKNPKAAIDGPSEAILATAFEMAELAGMRIGVIREEGEPHERIAERAREGRFDVIVLGFERRRSLRHALFGTMHTKLAGGAHTDILVIPRASEIAWDRTFYLDWLPQPSPKAFARALDFCRAYGSQLSSATFDFTKARDAELTLHAPVHPSSNQIPIREDPPQLLQTAGHDSSIPIERSRDRAKVIASRLAAERIGLFFLPYRAGSGLGGWVTRRFLERMILDSPCPVMILQT
jgi:nucleotide-binding universal stress UspA family protein